MFQIDFKVPDKAASDDVYRAALVRAFYQTRAYVNAAVKDGLVSTRIPKTLDFPKSMQSVWYMAVTSGRKGCYNPLWAVDYHALNQLSDGKPFSAWAIADDALSGAYKQHGYVSTRKAVARLTATLASLNESVPAHGYMYNLDDEAALESVRSTADLDPVVELLWRDRKGVQSSALLQCSAVLNYAFTPLAYAHPSYPEDWLVKRELRAWFGKQSYDDEDDGEFARAPAVDGLLSAL